MSKVPANTLRPLSEDQAVLTLQNLFTEIDDAIPLVTEEAIRQRGNDDHAYVRDLMQASSMSIDGSEAPSYAALLQVIYESVPEIQPDIDSAVDDALTETSSKLVVETAFLVEMLAVAVAVAIMRPRISVVTKTSKSGKETSVAVEVRGIKNLAGILKVLSNFL